MTGDFRERVLGAAVLLSTEVVLVECVPSGVRDGSGKERCAKRCWAGKVLQEGGVRLDRGWGFS